MSYVLRCHEDIDSASKSPFRNRQCRYDMGGSGIPSVWPRLPLRSQGPFRHTCNDAADTVAQKGVQAPVGRACEDSIHHSYSSLLETGLSRHRQISQDTFLFLRCNNLTGIDEVKYILESLSMPVRFDHDRNI